MAQVRVGRGVLRGKILSSNALSGKSLSSAGSPNQDFLVGPKGDRLFFHRLMDVESVRDELLRQPHATEETPFGPDHFVYKIAGHKMYAILSPDELPARLNLKCDPDRALDLRDRYEAIEPGYHMNKRHWSTVSTDGNISDRMICQWIDTSYELVVDQLSIRDQKWLGHKRPSKK